MAGTTGVGITVMVGAGTVGIIGGGIDGTVGVMTLFGALLITVVDFTVVGHTIIGVIMATLIETMDTMVIIETVDITEEV